MSVKWVQDLYNSIRNFKAPDWLKVLILDVQNMIVAMFVQIGKDYLSGLQAKVAEVNGMNISSENKFNAVFKWGKDNMPDIKDSILRLLIEIIVNKIKLM